MEYQVSDRSRGQTVPSVLTRGQDRSRAPLSARSWGHPSMKLQGSGGGDPPESRGGDRDRKVGL